MKQTMKTKDKIALATICIALVLFIIFLVIDYPTFALISYISALAVAIFMIFYETYKG